jgi:hypothetical protein
MKLSDDAIREGLSREWWGEMTMIRAKREVSEGQHSIEAATLWKKLFKVEPDEKISIV